MIDGLGRDHQRLGDLHIGGAAHDQVQDLGLARRQPGRARLGGGARPARDPAHAVRAQAPPQVQRRALGAERVEGRQRLEPRLLVVGLRERLGAVVRVPDLAPRCRRRAPVAGDRCARTAAGRPRAAGTGAPPRQSQNASSARAQTSPSPAASSYAGRAIATIASRSPSSQACSARAAAAGAEPLQLLGLDRALPRLARAVAPACGSPRRAGQPAEHDQRRALADAELLAHRDRRVRVGLGARASRRAARAAWRGSPSMYWR